LRDDIFEQAVSVKRVCSLLRIAEILFFEKDLTELDEVQAKYWIDVEYPMLLDQFITVSNLLRDVSDRLEELSVILKD